MPEFLWTVYSEKILTIDKPLRLETEPQGHPSQQEDKQQKIIITPLFMRKECEEGLRRQERKERERMKRRGLKKKGGEDLERGDYKRKILELSGCQGISFYFHWWWMSLDIFQVVIGYNFTSFHLWSILKLFLKASVAFIIYSCASQHFPPRDTCR